MRAEQEIDAYVQQYGKKYMDFVAAMDVQDPNFERTLRKFDPRAENIPGLQGAIEDKVAEREEYLEKQQKQHNEIADQQKKERAAEEKMENAILDTKGALIKENLTTEDYVKFQEARRDKDAAAMEAIYQQGLARRDENAELENQKKAEEAALEDRTRRAEYASKQVTNIGKLRKSLNDDIKPLIDKKKAYEEWQSIGENKRQETLEKTPDYVAPVPLTEQEQEYLDTGTREIESLEQAEKIQQLIIDRMEYADKVGEKDAILDRFTPEEEADPNSPYNQAQAALAGIPVLEEEQSTTKANHARTYLMKVQNDTKLQEAQQKMDAFLSGADQLTDEQVEESIALQSTIDNYTARSESLAASLAENKEQEAVIGDSISELQAQNIEYRNNKYQQSLTPDGRKFRDDDDDARFRSAYAAYAMDNNLSVDPDAPDRAYDYRRAYAEGDFTMSSESLPDKYRLAEEDDTNGIGVFRPYPQ